jgi:DNA replication and repair protein RecF
MQLISLHLVHFKNIGQLDLELSPVVNCFLGNNGEGKTSILDAIYYLSYTKSYFNSIDYQNIQFEQPFFVVQGIFDKTGELSNVYCGVKRGDKKTIKINKKTYTKLSDHIGKFPVVMITPYDSNLILEGSETRRKFLDAMIAQFDRSYLLDIIYYNKAMQQRNALLKQFAEKGNYQESLLDIYTDQLVRLAALIHTRRREFVDEFVPVFANFYRDISSGKEAVSLVYESQFNDTTDFATTYKNALTADLKATYCTVGVHKDDLSFMLGEHSLKKFGSQGQQKSYLIALKLAQFEFIKMKLGFSPILLLDDIFDKLDDQRVGFLLELISRKKVGQTFITDTSLTKVPELLNKLGVSFSAFTIEKGSGVPLTQVQQNL